MIKLSLNQAAKEAGIAKKTLLEALKSGKISGLKNDNGYWEIQPAELFRVFPKSGLSLEGKRIDTPDEKTSDNKALEVEARMLKEQLIRERELMQSQIDSLQNQLERQGEDYRQSLALLTDQRPSSKGFWSWIRRT